MFSGEYICLDCKKEFKSSNPMINSNAFKMQAIIHAVETGHENYQMIGLNIKTKIKTNF